MEMVVEKALLEQARNGQESAFTQLVEMHSENTIKLAWRLVGQREVAEELAQEAFLRFFRSLTKFRGDSRVSTWLYRTVTRLAIDHLRREQLRHKLFFFRRAVEQIDLLENFADPAASPQELLLARETSGRMRQVVNSLPPQQKAVFVLRHDEELPLKEIAALLDLKEGTVKAHLHRAVNRLREEFSQTKDNS